MPKKTFTLSNFSKGLDESSNPLLAGEMGHVVDCADVDFENSGAIKGNAFADDFSSQVAAASTFKWGGGNIDPAPPTGGCISAITVTEVSQDPWTVTVADFTSDWTDETSNDMPTGVDKLYYIMYVHDSSAPYTFVGEGSAGSAFNDKLPLIEFADAPTEIYPIRKVATEGMKVNFLEGYIDHVPSPNFDAIYHAEAGAYNDLADISVFQADLDAVEDVAGKDIKFSYQVDTINCLPWGVANGHLLIGLIDSDGTTGYFYPSPGMGNEQTNFIITANALAEKSIETGLTTDISSIVVVVSPDVANLDDGDKLFSLQNIKTRDTAPVAEWEPGDYDFFETNITTENGVKNEGVPVQIGSTVNITTGMATVSCTVDGTGSVYYKLKGTSYTTLTGLVQLFEVVSGSGFRVPGGGAYTASDGTLFLGGPPASNTFEMNAGYPPDTTLITPSAGSGKQAVLGQVAYYHTSNKIQMCLPTKVHIWPTENYLDLSNFISGTFKSLMGAGELLLVFTTTEVILINTANQQIAQVLIGKGIAAIANAVYYEDGIVWSSGTNVYYFNGSKVAGLNQTFVSTTAGAVTGSAGRMIKVGSHVYSFNSNTWTKSGGSESVTLPTLHMGEPSRDKKIYWIDFECTGDAAVTVNSESANDISGAVSSNRWTPTASLTAKELNLIVTGFTQLNGVSVVYRDKIPK